MPTIKIIKQRGSKDAQLVLEGLTDAEATNVAAELVKVATNATFKSADGIHMVSCTDLTTQQQDNIASLLPTYTIISEIKPGWSGCYMF